MKLSENKFRETVQMLQTLSDVPKKQDKRRSNRAEIHIPVDIKYSTGKILSSWLQAELCDLSPRGLCLCVKLALETGQSFVVRFPTKKGSPTPSPLICRVIHCKEQKDHTHLVGAEFTGQLETVQPGANSVAEAERIRVAILG